jgi:hypothetical protein
VGYVNVFLDGIDSLLAPEDAHGAVSRRTWRLFGRAFGCAPTREMTGPARRLHSTAISPVSSIGGREARWVSGIFRHINLGREVSLRDPSMHRMMMPLG